MEKKNLVVLRKLSSHATFVPPWIRFPGLCELLLAVPAVVSRVRYPVPLEEVVAYCTQWHQWASSATDPDMEVYRACFPAPRTFEMSPSPPSATPPPATLPVRWYAETPKTMLAALRADEDPVQRCVFFWRPYADPSASSGKRTRAEASAASALDTTVGPHSFSQWWMNTEKGEPQFYALSSSSLEGYCSAEQYMMSQKARLFNDAVRLNNMMDVAEMASTEDMGGVNTKLRKLGRQVTPFDPQTWDKHAFSIVAEASYLKFTSSEELRRFILTAGPPEDGENDDEGREVVLVEASPKDAIWGIGAGVTSKAKAKELSDPSAWRGTNYLGFALMCARDEIKRVYHYYDLLHE